MHYFYFISATGPCQAEKTTMNIHLLLTGSELLNGVQLDTDLRFIGGELAAAGLSIGRALVVGDDRAALLRAFSELADDADALIVTGGLGSTCDDLTRDAAAAFFGLELRRDEDLVHHLLRHYRRRHPEGSIPKTLFRQADVPEGATLLPNENGSAPGLRFTGAIGGRSILVYLLPGPPRELEPMFRESVLPELARAGGERFRAGFLALGLGELELEQRLAAFPLPPEIEVALCAVPAGTRLFFAGPDRAAAERALAAFRETLPMPQPEPGETELAPALVRRLAARGLTCGLAESCTGGLAAAALVDVSGASAVFRGSVTAYHNDIKRGILGVSEEILREHGAVSEACAAAMARGALQTLKVDLAGAVTGIAGPEGGSEAKPVGTVFCAVARGENVTVEELHLSGDRAAIRAHSAAHLLRMLFAAL